MQGIRGISASPSLYIINSSSQIYPNARNNQLARIMYQELAGSDKIEIDVPPVTTKDQMEISRDERVKTTTKVENNRRDIIIWRPEKRLCQIAEITVPLDTNLRKAYKEKQEKFIPLITNMQRMYNGYRYELMTITVEAIRKLNFDQDSLKILANRSPSAVALYLQKQLECMNTPELKPFVFHEIDMANACPKELIVDKGHESDEATNIL